MSKSKLLDSVKSSARKVKYKTIKNSSEIMVVAGVIGMVASAVLACRATKKATPIIEDAKNLVERIGEVAEESEEYSAEDAKGASIRVYANTGLQLAKIYAPAVLVGGASIASIFTGHNVLRKRSAILATSYAMLSKSFNEYRERVVDRYGKDIENKILYNIKNEKIEETITDENGKTKKVKKDVEVIALEDSVRSPFSKFYDSTCTGWCKDPEANLDFVYSIQKFANQKLKTNKYLFLNEVYESLGIPKTKAGQMFGWIYDENLGEDQVDFGIFRCDEPSRRFVNGYEPVLLMDFNVENILDQM